MTCPRHFWRLQIHSHLPHLSSHANSHHPSHSLPLFAPPVTPFLSIAYTSICLHSRSSKFCAFFPLLALFTPHKTERTLFLSPALFPLQHFLLSALNTFSFHNMAAIVCHGLQSHLESQLVESRTLRLRLPSSKTLPPPPPQPIDLSFKSCLWDSNIKTQYEEEEINNNNNKTNTNVGGWSFLEALSNVSQGTKEPSQKEEASYVHPQQKRSSLLLSPKSLELCTENLGNESGTDIAENGIDMLSSTHGNLETGEQKQQQHQPQQLQEQPRQHSTAKKAKTLNFPPPLTTIRGSESLRVRPHREDGRLVIEVTKVPPSPSCFQAERSHGRLRLCLLKNHDPSFDPEGEDVVINENEPMTNEGFEEEFGNEVIGQAQDSEQEEEKEEEEEEETEEAGEEGVLFACGCQDIKGGGDMRMEKFEIEMPRRCKEGSDHENNELLLNWVEPFWVATS